MARLLSRTAIILVIAWVLAHLLFLGPIREPESGLAFGPATGRNRPAWLRFVVWVRSGAALIGCGLIVVGLLHYRDTEPRGEIHWVILGLAVLAGAGAVHWWVVRTQREIY